MRLRRILLLLLAPWLLADFGFGGQKKVDLAEGSVWTESVQVSTENCETEDLTQKMLKFRVT